MPLSNISVYLMTLEQVRTVAGNIVLSSAVLCKILNMVSWIFSNIEMLKTVFPIVIYIQGE